MIEQTTINPNQRIQGWIIEAFNLPKETVIDITSPTNRTKATSRSFRTPLAYETSVRASRSSYSSLLWRWTPLAYGKGRLISPLRRNHITKRECIEEQLSSMDTVITVHSCRDHTHEYTIPKPPADIKYEDIELLRTGNEHEHHTHKKNTIFGYLFRFSIWWLSLSGLYMLFATCPCCGQVGCPVGAGSAGLIGGFLTLCKQNWKGFIKLIHSKLFRSG